MLFIHETIRAIKPPPRLLVSEWADSYRQLSSEASAEPGQWHTARAEYQRGIMDAVTEPGIETIVFMKSAQVGATELLNNIVGYHIAQDPAPMLLLQPTLEMAQTWSKDRLAPMVRDTPELANKIEVSNRRSSGNTLRHKVFPGGHITMAGANSPASLASRPIRIVLCDEVDRYPASAGAEGDPVNLARKRTTTFWNRKVILTSTPTTKGVSRIEREFELSDQRRYFVPCPDCGHMQHFQWSQVEWLKDSEGQALPDTARYCCEQCSSLWDDGQRLGAIRRGVWRATASSNTRAGFHLNEMYSPWVPLEKLVRGFLEAKGNPETMKTWVNTSLGESWEEEAEGVDQLGIMNRRESYVTDVPAGGLVLTAGVDVQGDRLEYEVVAWGHGEESWGIQNGVIPGDPALPDVWRDLDMLLEQNWAHESGGTLNVAATGIDTGGHHTQIVYDYCRKRAHRRVFALKGVAGSGRPVINVSRRKAGAKARNVDLYQVGVDDAKGITFARLRVSEPGPSYCHFPESYQEEYFLQLTAEKVVTRFHKGYPRREWIKTRARNEALDCRVYAFAVMKALNPVWSSLERRITTKNRTPAKQTVEQHEQSITNQTLKRRRARQHPAKKNWVTNF
ncbi:phage terminase large subunit family protein [Congregibacter brevis]|uniref:Phage terminase large subunit family protein n=1 Tax=Congregibacter brevis TaxID=3081201 RepID=A0ABZ0I8D8_9GAMM|nr:phage terminase large subunit family protein [Congregibacter sp. IMCC45268]